KTLTLRTTSSLVDYIAWTSDKPAVVDPLNGDVVRPAAGQPDAVVTLTAQVSLNGYSEIRTFAVSVKAQEPVNNEKAEAIEAAIKAIEAVGTPITYSADLEVKLAQADTAIKTAKSHGATDSDITNMSKLTAAKETVSGWKEKVALERLSLTIGYQSGDDAASVTKTLTLRTTSSLVDSIAWTSDKPAVVNPLNGQVARPVAGQPDAVVTLTVQVSLNGYSEVRTFAVSVKAQEPVNNEKAEAIDAAIKAIEAVGTPVTYSADLEVKFAQADTAIKTAKLH
ncbi:immunoglobulin-like domain-containing protein, partial [Paenibacillus hemerocallicola]|uniref:immunoglobulin-like domain-containing protein n=1 Tax=Paenibacillus hemerocallicola TaxID=1172614 RepID=UPI00159EECDC